MFEADITNVVEEMAVHIRETEEDFILDTIYPYCQEILQRKINKAELKQIILRGSRPKGKWIRITNGAMREKYICSECGRQIEEDGIEALIAIKYPYCHCGAEMSGGSEDGV